MYKYRLTISDGNKVYITKNYCYLSRFDFKVHSSVLFLLSAEKDKKKPDKDLQLSNNVFIVVGETLIHLKNIIN